MNASRSPLFALFAIALGSGCTRADAFVRTLTANTNMPIAWQNDCVFMQLETSSVPGMSVAEAETVVEQSSADWNVATADCSHMQLKVAAPVSDVEVSRADRRNIVKFRTDVWGYAGQDSNWEPSAIAITNVNYDPVSGTITDADVELNAVYFTFGRLPIVDAGEDADGDVIDPDSIYDLENTLTHEFGHVLGLAHTCGDSGLGFLVSTGGVDPTTTIPDCGDDPTYPTDTMYPMAGFGETTKRQPKVDDVNGICAAYPAGKATNVCRPLTLSTGCSMGARGETPWPIAFFALFLAFVRRRLSSRA